jgi:hypothetical protein
MKLPWEGILGALGGYAVFIGLGVLFARKVVEKVVETTAKGFESAYTRAENAHKKQLEIAGSIDLDLRQRRIGAYQEMWARTSLLPMWPRAKNVTYEKLNELSEALRDWYFGSGGMYLSAKTRETYGDLQQAIKAVLDQTGSGPLTEQHYDSVRDKCSALRSQMTDDILSRRPAPLA